MVTVTAQFELEIPVMAGLETKITALLAKAEELPDGTVLSMRHDNGTIHARKGESQDSVRDHYHCSIGVVMRNGFRLHRRAKFIAAGCE